MDTVEKWEHGELKERIQVKYNGEDPQSKADILDSITVMEVSTDPVEISFAKSKIYTTLKRMVSRG